jgi:hypothetical protein
MKTHKELYPTGHKFCSCCRRWRKHLDFGPRTWVDEPHCTVVKTLHSQCYTCEARLRRRRTGYKPRNWYPHGKPGSVQYREYRRARNRHSYKQRAKDPEYRKRMAEYSRIWYNSRHGTVSNSYNTAKLGKSPRVDRKPFDETIASLGYSHKELARLTGFSDRTFYRDDTDTILLSTADAVFTKLGKPWLTATLWPTVA